MNVAAPPQRRDDVIVIEVGAEAVLYDPVEPGVHHLNATAVLVWKCCDGSADVRSIGVDLAETFAEPPGTTVAVVEKVIEVFSDHGLLVDPSNSMKPRADGAVPPSRVEPRPDISDARLLGPYAAVDRQFTIECLGSEPLADELERVLGSLSVRDSEHGAEVVTPVVVWSDGRGHHFDADGVQHTAPDPSTLVDFAVRRITRFAVEGSPRYLVVHASAVARDGQAVMLPAQANSGKSTLATLLVEAGFDYLTDEASFVDLETGEIVAFPKPIMLDPGSQELLAHLEPPGLTGESIKWRITPESVRPGSVVQRAQLAHIVLPTHRIDAANTLVACDVVDGVVALLAAAVNVADHVDRLDDLVTLVEACTVNALDHDGVEGPRVAIESLFAAAPLPS